MLESNIVDEYSYNVKCESTEHAQRFASKLNGGHPDVDVNIQGTQASINSVYHEGEYIPKDKTLIKKQILKRQRDTRSG